MASKSGFVTIFSSRVQKEIAKSWEWYEDRQPGLGDRFVNEVLFKIKLVEQHPERYPTRYKSYKETPIAVFPFLIIYRLNPRKKIIRIVSVFHTSLHPKKK
jgi:plasmid stabilization system protein ParE